MRAIAQISIAAMVLLGCSDLGGAQTPADFFKGRTIDLYIGYSVGGGYDVYARMIARHMGRHIPGNPTIIPKNMEGAGELALQRRAPRRHGIRHGFARRPVRSAAGISGHPVRWAGVHLDRKRQ
jgi:tripartite-type tricarboxylate transporter receptor subunit TctC